MIYLDNASTTEVSIDIINDIYNNIKEIWGNPSNIYELGLKSKRCIDENKIQIANSLGCLPEEIYFVSGSSEGNSWALTQRKYCASSFFDHHSVTSNPKTLRVPENYWFKLNNYNLHSSHENVVCSHVLVNSETGIVFDVNPIFKQARELGAFCFCDMTQALGNIKINIKDYDIDMATFSLHKIGGPKGLGIVYINKEYDKKIIPLIYGSQENGVRGGTQNIPYISISGKLVEKAQTICNDKQEYCEKLSNIAIEILKNSGINYIINRPDEYKYINSTLNFCLKGIESEIIQSVLSEKNIFIGVGSACTSGMMEDDWIMKALEVPESYNRGQIRLSFNINNTEKEVEIAMKEIIKTYKEII